MASHGGGRRTGRHTGKLVASVIAAVTVIGAVVALVANSTVIATYVGSHWPFAQLPTDGEASITEVRPADTCSGFGPNLSVHYRIDRLPNNGRTLWLVEELEKHAPGIPHALLFARERLSSEGEHAVALRLSKSGNEIGYRYDFSIVSADSSANAALEVNRVRGQEYDYVRTKGLPSGSNLATKDPYVVTRTCL